MSKRRSSFRDKTTSDADRQKNRGSQFSYLNLPDGISQFKEKPSSSIELDIIPYVVTDSKHPDRNEEDEVAVKESLWYKRPIRVHHNVGTGDQSRTIICPSSIGKPCPICEHRALRREKGADQEEIQKMNYSYRNLYVVKPVHIEDYPRGYKDIEEKFYIWDIAQGNFQKLLNDELWEDADRGIFPDLEEGLTLKIRFSAEEIFKTEYAKASKIEFLERDKPYKESILDDVPNLDEVPKVLSYKEIDALFFSDEAPEEELKKEEETPRERRQHKREGGEDEGKDKKSKKNEPKRNKCPHGFEFGKDYDRYGECDNCDDWKACEKIHDEAEE
jgi:hypothetical protein